MTTRTTLPIGPMSRRRLLTVLVAAPLVTSLLAACGSDGSESSGSDGSESTTPTVPAVGFTYPTGAQDVVVRIDTGVGGYTTPEWSFARIPAVVVAGDGTTISPGAQIEIYPAPMLPALQASKLEARQIEELLARADVLGLLAAPPDYVSTQPPVADAGSTVVTLTVNGTTFVHDAPALGLEEQADDARKRLAEFVSFATSFVGEAGASAELFEPASFVVGTMVVNTSDYTGDIAPTVVPWPASFGEPPVGEACATIDGAVARTELASANQLTFFEVSEGNGGVPTIVQLLLRPLLPGSETC